MSEIAYHIPEQTQIVDTITYPVKSLRGISQPNGVTLTDNGLEGDRMFMLAGTAVDEEGIAPRLTLREHPELAQIATQQTPEGIQLSADGLGKLVLPHNIEEGDPRRVRSWGGPVTGVHISSEIDAWLGDFLQRDDVQILAVPDSARRTLAREDQNKHAYEFTGRATDGYPLHVISLASLRRLNEVRAAKGMATLGAGHFRANVIIDGENLAPFEEDASKGFWVENGNTGVDLVALRACERCVTVEADPATGKKYGNVLRSIAMMREGRSAGSKLVFGTWAAPECSGVASTVAPGQLVSLFTHAAGDADIS